MNHLKRGSSIRTIVLMWFGWCVVMVCFQAFVTARLQPERPDRVLFWTATETTATAQQNQIYLTEPFLNQHVAWDSEYYLSIATAGYRDSEVRSVQATSAEILEIRPGMNVALMTDSGETLPLNYAFFPFYPSVTRLLAIPFSAFGLNTIATATLAGVVVSMLGTLAGMIALYDLTKARLGERGGIRTAFYLIIFPTGMFLAQVYTEGLFVGLAFGALAMTQRKRWVGAALLAACATLTRAVGVALFVPLIMPWLRSGDWMDLDLEWRELYFSGIPWRAVGRALLHLSPIITFLLWRFSFYGFAFAVVEELYFGRGVFMVGTSFAQWLDAFRAIGGENGQRSTYYLIEFGAIILGIWSCLATRKQYPALSWYGLLAIVIALTSGPAQGMHRYILAAPSVFIFLGRLGESEAFDRVWTIASVLLMGLLATLFSFDFWVG
ncbi:MAG: mannosyltransferase family protein [Candidatus Promineifilaceae bacterium]